MGYAADNLLSLLYYLANKPNNSSAEVQSLPVKSKVEAQSLSSTVETLSTDSLQTAST
jgi:hypothetical protein